MSALVLRCRKPGRQSASSIALCDERLKAFSRHIDLHGIVDFEDAIEEPPDAIAEEVARRMVEKFEGAE